MHSTGTRGIVIVRCANYSLHLLEFEFPDGIILLCGIKNIVAHLLLLFIVYLFHIFLLLIVMIECISYIDKT